MKRVVVNNSTSALQVLDDKEKKLKTLCSKKSKDEQSIHTFCSQSGKYSMNPIETVKSN